MNNKSYLRVIEALESIKNVEELKVCDMKEGIDIYSYYYISGISITSYDTSHLSEPNFISINLFKFTSGDSKERIDRRLEMPIEKILLPFTSNTEPTSNDLANEEKALDFINHIKPILTKGK